MQQVLFSTHYFSFEQDGHGVGFVRGGNEVLVVPLATYSDVMLAVEPSAAFGQPTLVLPGGETEADESLIETASRELQEEIGFKAGQIDSLGEVRPFSKYLTVRIFLYLARDLTASRLEGDEDYTIRAERVPLAGFEVLIRNGQLLDARVIAALYLARDFIAQERQ